MTAPRVSFLGATQTVTGSRYLLTGSGGRVLVDCGLFQGYKYLRRKNWMPPPFEPAEIDAVLLTHAHLDHSGWLPLLVRDGFRGPIYATPGTIALSQILLPDSGYIQEEQARHANRRDYSKHKPALPLYTKADAEECLKRLEMLDFDKPLEVVPGVRAQFTASGHLLGAASVRVKMDGRSILFSGDIGRSNDLLMRAPAPPPGTDYVVVESTYGDRTHPAVDPLSELERAIHRAVERGGVIVIPSFAVGRAQLVMLLIARLQMAGRIPVLPVFLDSPMAIDASELLTRYRAEHRLSDADIDAIHRVARPVRTGEQSKALSQLREPAIIISASGMATGGRVVHHLKVFASDARSSIVLTGFQAAGTRGAALAAGADSLRIHGETIPVRAEVVQLSSLSAHADANEIMTWLRQLPSPPKRIFITHGEPAASDALRQRIERELGWNIVVPEYRDEFELDAAL